MTGKNSAKWWGQIRHLLTVIGAAAVAGDYVPQEQWDQIAGGVLALGAFVMSWNSKAKKVGHGDLG